jgi:hypothetical protein
MSAPQCRRRRSQAPAAAMALGEHILRVRPRVPFHVSRRANDGKLAIRDLRN